MSKGLSPPPCSFIPVAHTKTPIASPSYAQAAGGVPQTTAYVKETNHPFTGRRQIVKTTIVGTKPMHMICPHCYAEIDTSTETKPGIIAYISGIIICLIRLPFGCCLIPCCINACKDVRHSCPNCKATLARRRR